MSEWDLNNYYVKRKPNPRASMGYRHPDFKSVDIGWRWCKDELPDEGGAYMVVLADGTIATVIWGNGSNPFEEVVQWCKLPEPLKEETDE